MSNNNNDSNLTFDVVANWLPALLMHKQCMFVVSSISQKPKASKKQRRREEVVVFELEVKIRLHRGSTVATKTPW